MSESSTTPVVVAVADEHDAALRYAAAEAQRDRRPLRVVHVVPPPRGIAGAGVAGASIVVSFQAVEMIADDLIKQQRERALELVSGAVPVETALRRGPVIDMLLEEARGADHLVVQHRHGSRLGRILTGSTAAALAARAPVPVVSVPESWTGPHAVPHVTVALGRRDLEGRWDGLLGKALREARRREASLAILHAWYVPAEYGDVGLDPATMNRWHDEARAEVEESITPWIRAHPEIDVRVDVPHERPVDAIVAASRHSDVLVVGRRRSDGLVHLGSVVRAVIRESQCPVLVVTPASRQAESTPVEPERASIP
jgi:nucleotide-binding universal stress UspA family protein